MKSHILSLFLISATSVFAQEKGEIIATENLTSFGAHPFQTLSLAGNIIGLSGRRPIPDVDYELIWDDNPELCGDFEAILADDYSRLTMSTDVIDLGRGYHTLAWTPDMMPQSPPLFLRPGEEITEYHLHEAHWRAQIEGMSFAYNVSMQSNNYRGWFGSCIGEQEMCDPLISAVPRQQDIVEFAIGARREAYPKLLGPSFSYPENASPTIWQDVPNVWFLQFMNVVLNKTGTFLVYFQPQNLNISAISKAVHGFMIWDITERHPTNYAMCWFSNPILAIQTPQTQGN